MAVSVGNDDEVMSTINITPFTDVLLVLLIIFIILASVTKEPKLPDAHNRELVAASQLVVIIDDQNHIQIGSNLNIPLPQLSQAFANLQDSTGHHFQSLIVKADPHTSYGTILQVMDAAKANQLTDFGLANHIEGQPAN